MEILFLGTSSGTPTKTRNVSGLALRLANAKQWCLVDCGEGTQHRILHTKLSLVNLEAIFITHIHGDHCYGLPGLLASAAMQNRTRPLYLAGPPALQRYLDGVMESTQLQLPYTLEFINVERMPAIAMLPDLHVQATALSHRVVSYAYSFTEKEIKARLNAAKLKADGIPPGPLWRRIQDGEDVELDDGRHIKAKNYLLPARKPRKIIVGGDNDTPGLLADEMRDADVLIHEATYTDEALAKIGTGPQHSSAKKVAQCAHASGIGNLILTHFSPRYQELKEEEKKGNGASLADLEAEARAVYRGNLFLAKDLERYVLDKAGALTANAPSK